MSCILARFEATRFFDWQGVTAPTMLFIVGLDSGNITTLLAFSPEAEAWAEAQHPDPLYKFPLATMGVPTAVNIIYSDVPNAKDAIESYPIPMATRSVTVTFDKYHVEIAPYDFVLRVGFAGGKWFLRGDPERRAEWIFIEHEVNSFMAYQAREDEQSGECEA